MTEIGKFFDPIYRFVRRRIGRTTPRDEHSPMDIRDDMSQMSSMRFETPYTTSLRRNALSQGPGRGIPLDAADTESVHGNFKIVKSRRSSVKNSSGGA